MREWKTAAALSVTNIDRDDLRRRMMARDEANVSSHWIQFADDSEHPPIRLIHLRLLAHGNMQGILRYPLDELLLRPSNYFYFYIHNRLIFSAILDTIPLTCSYGKTRAYSGIAQR